MPENTDDTSTNSEFKSARRQARRGGQPKQTRPRRRGRERRISVRSELRETPDVHKIARAVIAMALAQAEADAKAASDASGNDAAKLEGPETPDA